MKKRFKKLLICALAIGFSAATFTACSQTGKTEHSGTDSEIVSPLPDGSNGNLGDSDSGNSGGNSGDSENGGNGNSDSQTPPTNSPTVTPPTAAPQPQKAEYIRVNASNVNVRSGAGTSYSVIGVAEKNESYAVLEKTGNWYKTYYKNKIAYVYAEYAAVFSLQKSADPKTEKVIEEGYKLLGVPYVYGAVRFHDGKGNKLGGFTASKFDCSSLVQYVFYKGANVLLNVTTRTQVTQGKYVAPENLRRGDCIYFTNEDRKNKTGIERVGHVAIYLGDNYILHTASDYARIEKMSTARWNFYIEARRFL
jgi:cell wall-associated NlpC family hydrolase